jgi:two-component system, NtrC family, response regulator HydG
MEPLRNTKQNNRKSHQNYHKKLSSGGFFFVSLNDMKILIVDDDPAFNKMLTNFLQRQDFSVDAVHTSTNALLLLKEKIYDLVITDYKLPDFDGIELIKKIKASYPSTPIILITNYSDIRTAVNSIKLGAFEFVTKPVIPDELLKTVRMALASAREKKPATESAPTKSPIKVIKGKNQKSVELWQHVDIVAPTKMSVLILGESGTGKEYVAKVIHDKSSRASGPFVALDCGVLSKELAASELFGHIKGSFTGAITDKTGHFEMANGGTLFLDEIGNLPYEVQIQLLRSVQERVIRKVGSDKEIKVDVRIIAATNENLLDRSASGEFRNDLYHRINEFEMRIPSLKERTDDLEEFCDFFIEEACADLNKSIKTISPEVIEVFQNYDWPGNLRELKNLLKRAVLLAPDNIITVDQLPEGIKAHKNEDFSSPADLLQSFDSGNRDLKELQKSQEELMIREALEAVKFNKAKAARMLNIDRSTLYKKIKDYGIDA